MKKLLLILLTLSAMGQTPSREVVNTGTAPNAGNGDSLYVGGGKINANFAQLWNDVYTNATIVNLKSFGAVGDGTTDDSAAIAAWSAAMTNGQTSYIPPGIYRINTTGQSILRRTNLSDVKIIGAPGAN